MINIRKYLLICFYLNLIIVDDVVKFQFIINIKILIEMIKKLTTSFLRTTKITSKAPLFSFSNVRDTLRKKLDE